MRIRFYLSDRTKADIETASELGAKAAAWAEHDDYCGLCDAHPSWGHERDCPVVKEALAAGKVPEPVED